ncbi:MAG: tRNA (guanine(46)-N(7))-methyltransferase TrmB [Beijerinckiaceae bacterium]|nr:tRNA (guanine(46)-N(7))-methyltransferase TrmB [Beijerinckiaceae bacterium]
MREAGRDVQRKPQGPPALHGRRKGKKLSAHRVFLVQTLLPRLSLDVSRPITDPFSLFPGRPEALWLEAGFGGGEHLVAEALAHPGNGYIGCEFYLNGIAKALALIEAHQLENIRLQNGDARTVIDALPPGCLDGAYVLFPDPWPKRRHRERRFLSLDMLARLARVMRKGAELRFATDIDDNAGWTLASVLRSHGFGWKATEAQDWQRPWKGWQGTRYEAKALRDGRRPAYFTFLRK